MPIRVKLFGSFSFGASGGFTLAASASSSPNPARLPDACATTPSATVISAAGTPHALAAASTNIVRAAAPAVLSCVQELAMAEEPPVPCGPCMELP